MKEAGDKLDTIHMAPSMVVKSDEENCIKECQKVCIPFSISSSISSHTIRYNLSNEDNKYSEGYNATQVMKEYTFSAKYVELKKTCPLSL